jgi:TetR/AcrR family transcriptional regulator, transcriptional repressor for nem operon
VAGASRARSAPRRTRRQTTSGTRERLVDAARYLFWEQGYAATGLAQILARAEANSGSFYHFFDSKDALLRTVLDTYVDLLDPHVLRPAWAATTDPMARVFVLLDSYRRRLLDTGCRYGCPIGRLALEIDPENTPAHALIARNFTRWKEAVEACLRAAGLPRPAEVATLVLTVMEGGVMQARAYRTIEPFDVCVRQLRLHLDALARTARPRGVAARRPRRRP